MWWRGSGESPVTGEPQFTGHEELPLLSEPFLSENGAGTRSPHLQTTPDSGERTKRALGAAP